MDKLVFFQRDPVEVIDIWLFRARTSYTNRARLLFNHAPTTPFAYSVAQGIQMISVAATFGLAETMAG